MAIWKQLEDYSKRNIKFCKSLKFPLGNESNLRTANRIIHIKENKKIDA